MSEPLKNIKILDLSRLLPGPYASLVLAEMGADILKVEDIANGDYARHVPPLAGDTSALFMALNRGKRNVCLKINSDAGRKIILELVKEYDIVLENFRPGVIDKMGIGYEQLKAANKGVILCSLTGYGQTGPYKHRAGHDLNYQALTGVVEMTGNRGGPPGIPGAQVADLAGGSQSAVIAILASVIGRQTTGEGAHLDVAMCDNLVALQPITMAEVLAGGTCPLRGDTILQGRYICYNIYETKDKCHMSFAALEPKFFMNFCKLVERTDMMDFHYASADENSEPYETMCEIFKSKTRAEWIELLKDVDACCEPVLAPNEIEKNPHLNSRNLFVDQQLKDKKIIKQAVAVPTLHEAGEKLVNAARLGQHTKEVLRTMGYNEDDIDKLSKDGLIYLGK